MTPSKSLPFPTLVLLISFASVNAILFTPGLPNLAQFFNITDAKAQQMITYYLLGYAFGQLLYGPLANRYGRKPSLYIGLTIQILSSLLCIYAAHLQNYSLLLLARVLLALGAGVGLKMTFTMVSESYTPKAASRILSYLVLGFAIIPGLSVALGGYLNAYFGWQSCFYACAIYGVLLLALITRMPETLPDNKKDKNALRLSYLVESYLSAFKNPNLICGGLLIGCATCFVYVFAALTPFIAISLYGLSSQEYGLANILPPIGMILGSLTSARAANKYQLAQLIRAGALIASVGVIVMLLAIYFNLQPIASLFLPMILIYFGLSFVMANTPALTMSYVSDKAHGSAVMSFINMGMATLVVLGIEYLSISAIILPLIFLAISILMFGLARRFV